MNLKPAKTKTFTLRTTKKNPLGELRKVLREAIAFIGEFEHIHQVKWKVVITVREKILDIG